MAILDPLFRFIENINQKIDSVPDFFLEAQADDEQVTDFLGQTIERSQPADEAAAVLVDILEEAILTELQDEGELTPENVEEVTDKTEGAAVAELLGIGGAGTALEALTAGQVDTHQEVILQALAGLGLDDVTGTELEARMSEGVMPALEAKVAKEHRSNFVALPDAVEALLRAKTADEGWLRGENVDQRWADAVASNEAVNPDNLIEEWGIRDDNLEILERVSLNAPEFEEILETPLQLGVPPSEEAIDEAIQLSGLPDAIAELFREAAANAEQSADMWEQKSVAGELVTEYDTLARDGEISPTDALDDMPEEIEPAFQSLEKRWDLLQDVPRGSPTRSMIEGSFASGYTSLDTLRDRLERLEYDVEAYEDVLRKQVLDELDGDLQEALALGLLNPQQYSEYAEFAGLDDTVISDLLAGQSLSDISKARLQEQQDPALQPVGSLLGVGEARASGLRAAGIETVGDMAGADPETVAEAAQVSTETAQEFISQAQQRVS